MFSKEELISFDGTPLYVEERPVRFQDVDAAGTIFFPRVFEYFGDAYQEVLARAGIDVPKMLRDRVAAAPLVHVEADYITPLFYGDRVRVEIVRAKVGASSVTLGHRLVNLKSNKIATVGMTVHVFVDGKTFQSCDVPAELATFLKR